MINWEKNSESIRIDAIYLYSDNIKIGKYYKCNNGKFIIVCYLYESIPCLKDLIYQCNFYKDSEMQCRYSLLKILQTYNKYKVFL